MIRRGLTCGALALALLSAWGGAAWAGPGDRDPRFSRDGVAEPKQLATAIPHAVFPGERGGIVLVAEARGRGGNGRHLPTVAHFTRAGRLDRSFGHGGIAQLDVVASVEAVTRTADGGVIFTSEGRGANACEFFKMNANGRIDRGFGDGGSVELALDGATPIPIGIAPMPDGSAVAAVHTITGGFPFFGNSSFATTLVRLLDSGEFDPGFGGGGFVAIEDELPEDIDVGEDGAISVLTWDARSGDEYYLENEDQLRRYTPAGEPDPAFSGDGSAPIPDSGYLEALATRPGGGVVVTGAFPGTNGLGVRALDATGALDASFSGGTASLVPFGAEGSHETDVDVDEDGRVLVGGDPRLDRLAYARFTPDGRPDRRFGIGGGGNVALGHDEESELASIASLSGNRVAIAGAYVDGMDYTRSPVVVASLGSRGGDDLDADGRGNGRDRCPDRFGPRRDGCPLIERSVGSFRYDRSTRFFRGKLEAAEWVCGANRITVFETRPGPDRKVGEDKTPSGEFKVPSPPLPGRYRAIAGARMVESDGVCERAASGAVKIR